MTDPHEPSVDLAYCSTEELLTRLDDGRLTSLRLVDVLLDRIDNVDAPETPTHLNAVAALASDARAIARERDEERGAGVRRGPLHGIPVLVKDNVEVANLPGVAGSTALAGRPARDAPLVTRLRDAGAIILGSTNLSQWANLRSPRSTSGYSAAGGLVANPWALDRSAGGSSSGSGAAVAAGLAPLAVGTETDGSIVCPASVNGVVGLKPTVGVVPATHVVPISASHDSPGPMGRTVDDVARLYAVLSQSGAPEDRDELSWGVATNWRTGDSRTDQLFDEIVADLRASGARVLDRELAVPGDAEGNDELAVLLAELHDDLTSYLAGRPGDGVASLADVVAYEDQYRDIELRYFGHEFFIRALESGGRAGESYAEARRRNVEWATETCLLPGLDGVDVVLAPAYGPAWKSDLVVGSHPGLASVATMAPAIAGWPIMSVPMGLVHDLPVGLALVGRAHSEWILLRAARRIEALVTERDPLPRPYWREATRG